MSEWERWWEDGFDDAERAIARCGRNSISYRTDCKERTS